MVNEALGCGVTRRRLLSLETGIINKWKLGKMIVNKTKMTLGNVRIPDLSFHHGTVEINATIYTMRIFLAMILLQYLRRDSFVLSAW